jgi:hypothetical protein
LPTASEILFAPIGSTPRPQRWGLVIGRYDRRVIWYAKGERLAHYDADMTTVAYFGDLPATMTRHNCEDFRYVQSSIVYRPRKGKA